MRKGKGTTLEERGGCRFITVDTLKRKGLVHAFGTRDFGARHSLAHARIKEVFAELNDLATVKQVHGKTAIIVDRASDLVCVRRHHADILITAEPNLAVAVRTADCTPLLLFDPVRKVAAAVHAGWKGTVARAGEEAVRLMSENFGARPGRMVAGIGPCIGTCHYQVDEPVIRGMKDCLGNKAAKVLLPDKEAGKARLDLSLANRIVLEQAGIPSANITEARMCTYCHDELFFSYRREGKGVPSLYHLISLGR